MYEKPVYLFLRLRYKINVNFRMYEEAPLFSKKRISSNKCKMTVIKYHYTTLCIVNILHRITEFVR